jgi:hypothetical protein
LVKDLIQTVGEVFKHSSNCNGLETDPGWVGGHCSAEAGPGQVTLRLTPGARQGNEGPLRSARGFA